MSTALSVAPAPAAPAPIAAQPPDAASKAKAPDAFAQELERAARADAQAASRQRQAAQDKLDNADNRRAAASPKAAAESQPAAERGDTQAKVDAPEATDTQDALPEGTDIGALLAQLQTLSRGAPDIADAASTRTAAAMGKAVTARRGGDSGAAEAATTALPTTAALATGADDHRLAPLGEGLARALTPVVPTELATTPRGEFAALLATAAPGTASTGAAGTPVTAEARLPASPGSPEFGSQFGAQLTTFVRAGVEHARLHLNPAEMGPVSVQIRLDGQMAIVHLGTDNPQTRQALEQAMPLLAGNLREAGLTLSGGGVFDQRGAGGQSDADPAAAARRPADDGEAQSASSLRGPAPAQRRGVVDLVA